MRLIFPHSLSEATSLVLIYSLGSSGLIYKMWVVFTFLVGLLTIPLDYNPSIEYQYNDFLVLSTYTMRLASEATISISVPTVISAKIAAMRYVCISPVLPSIIKKYRVFIPILRSDNEHPR